MRTATELTGYGPTRRTFVGALALIRGLVATSATAQTPVAGTPAATPAPAPDSIASLLPTEAEVPEGLVVTQDGERTLDDVLSGFPARDEAAAHFEEWGWQGNVVRAFHVEGTPDDPEGVDGIYVSIHRFGSPGSAAEALDFIVDVHEFQDTKVTEQGHDTLGDASRVLWGEQSYGSEVTLYVQQGDVVIRLSANSPEGDPSQVAWDLIDTILARPYFA